MGRPRGPSQVHRAMLQAGAVTALSPLDASGARFRLAQGDLFIVVSSELIGDYKLTANRTLTASEAQALSVAAARLAVFDKAVSLLGVKARSSRDLRLALRRRGASTDEAQSALLRLQELGLLDDASFARGTAQMRAAASGASRRQVEQLLVRKGIAPGVAKNAATEAFAGVDESGAVRELAARRMRSLASLDRVTQRRRLYAWLARRGYAPSIVSAVVRELVGGQDTTDGD